MSTLIQLLLIVPVMIALLTLTTYLPLLHPLFGQSSAPSSDFSAIDAFVEAQMKQNGLPGVTRGNVQGNPVVHLQAFGQADDSGQLLTPQAPVRRRRSFAK